MGGTGQSWFLLGDRLGDSSLRWIQGGIIRKRKETEVGKSAESRCIPYFKRKSILLDHPLTQQFIYYVQSQGVS